MLKIAQILYDKAHYIFEDESIPDWPPDPEGNPIMLVDITDKPEVQEGWDYDKETGIFTEPVYEDIPYVEPEPTAEELQMQTLLNTEYLVIISELNS